MNTSRKWVDVHEIDAGATIRLSKTGVYDVVALIPVYDVVALNTYP